AVDRERVADPAQLVFRDASAPVDHLGAEHLAAEAGVGLRLVAAQAVIDVQRRDRVPELAQRVPETGRVGTARDEHGDRAPGLDQAVATDLPLDAAADLGGIDPHAESVAVRATGGRRSRASRAAAPSA